MQPKMDLIKDFAKLKPLFYNLIITGIIILVLSNPITSHLYLNNMDKDSTFHAEQNQIYREFENIKEDENYKIIFLGSSMTREDIETFIEEATPNESLLLADGLDEAFLGVAVEEDTPRAVYSIERAINALTKEGMTHEEADEYFWFNTAGACVGEQTPIWVNTPE